MADDNSQYTIGNGMDAVSAMQNLYNTMLHKAEEEAKPVDTTEQPISPHDILRDLPNVYQRRVERVVKMINVQLESRMDFLEDNLFCHIEIHVATPHERKIAEDACQQFVDVGWSVTESDLVTKITLRDTLLLKFGLPGKLSQSDTAV